MSWIAAALLAALCAGITSILAKCGMRDTDSDIATGIRTAVVLVFAWLVVFVTDAQAGIGNIAPLSWAFLIASGVATGASWLCYFKALSLGDVNKVVPGGQIECGNSRPSCHRLGSAKRAVSRSNSSPSCL